jgi:hypothetical protein
MPTYLSDNGIFSLYPTRSGTFLPATAAIGDILDDSSCVSASAPLLDAYGNTPDGDKTISAITLAVTASTSFAAKYYYWDGERQQIESLGCSEFTTREYVCSRVRLGRSDNINYRQFQFGKIGPFGPYTVKGAVVTLRPADYRQNRLLVIAADSGTVTDSQITNPTSTHGGGTENVVAGQSASWAVAQLIPVAPSPGDIGPKVALAGPTAASYNQYAVQAIITLGTWDDPSGQYSAAYAVDVPDGGTQGVTGNWFVPAHAIDVEYTVSVS